MLALVVLFIVVPIVELYLIVQMSHAIGFANTLGLLIVISILGGWLVRHQGMRVWNRFQQQVHQGAVPSREIVDGALLLLAGALLLTPGFLTDAIGIVLLLPPVRAVVRVMVLRRMRRRPGVIRATHGGRITDHRVIDTGTQEEAGG